MGSSFTSLVGEEGNLWASFTHLFTLFHQWRQRAHHKCLYLSTVLCVTFPACKHAATFLFFKLISLFILLYSLFPLLIAACIFFFSFPKMSKLLASSFPEWPAHCQSNVNYVFLETQQHLAHLIMLSFTSRL